MTAFYIILGVLVLLAVITVTRALCVKSSTVSPAQDYIPAEIDMDTAVRRLQGAVQIPTVSLDPDDDGTKAPFIEFHGYLEEAFPLFHDNAKRTVVNDCALIYEIEGTDLSLKPVCFLGHMDVVPPQKEGWEHEPFSADVDDTFIYGRGTFDMKGQLTALLESLEILFKQGRRPVRTVYCCFGCDEEVSGASAKAMCDRLKAEGKEMEFIFDEGMTLLDASAVGINPLALVGVCEKGYANIKVTAKGNAGHASMPPRKNSATILAKAITKINRHPMRAYWSEPVNCLIDKVAPHAKFGIRLIMANKWLFKPLLKPILCTADSSTNAMLRSTFAITMLQGSDAANVIPAESSCIINCRLNTGETVQQVLRHIEKTVGKTCTVQLLPSGYHEATEMSPVDTCSFRMLEKTVAEIFPGAITAPFPFPAGTDSKYYSDLSDSIFKFSPHITNAEDRGCMHNVNERFRLSAYEGDIRFYLRFLENTAFSKEFK